MNVDRFARTVFIIGVCGVALWLVIIYFAIRQAGNRIDEEVKPVPAKQSANMEWHCARLCSDRILVCKTTDRVLATISYRDGVWQSEQGVAKFESKKAAEDFEENLILPQDCK